MRVTFLRGYWMGFSKDRKYAMREEVKRIIPRIVYVEPKLKLRNFEDAFDLAIKGA